MVVTSKSKKTKRKKTAPRPAKVARLRASAEEPLFSGEEDSVGSARWSRPRKQKVSLHLDVEVVDWFRSAGPGYQPRINAILRKAMREEKKRAEK